jgi:uncharacterized phage protein (TIGR02218 family)
VIDVPTELSALITSGNFAMLELFVVTTLAGQIARVTTYPEAVTFDNNVYSPYPLFKRGVIKSGRGLEVDTMDLDIIPRLYPYHVSDPAEEDLIGGYNWHWAITMGLLSGAQVDLYKLFLTADRATLVGAIQFFRGNFGEIEGGLAGFKAEVKSFLDKFNLQVPQNVMQPGCRHTVFSPGCGLEREIYGVSGLTAGGSTRLQINCNLPHVAGYFNGGHLLMTEGRMAGIYRTILVSAPYYLQLKSPLPEAPAIDDPFQAWPGCDRTLNTCDTKYANLANYGGQPYAPVQEALY